MPYVNLPPGCRQLAFEDGGKPVVADRRGRAWVSDSRAKMIDSMSGNGDAGLVTGQYREYGAVAKPGRWCTWCRRLWYPWSVECPRCGQETVLE